MEKKNIIVAYPTKSDENGYIRIPRMRIVQISFHSDTINIHKIRIKSQLTSIEGKTEKLFKLNKNNVDKNDCTHYAISGAILAGGGIIEDYKPNEKEKILFNGEVEKDVFSYLSKIDK